ncbi:mitochondrial ribosomal death-associated protein 3-domain-containing protein [Crepidotus variabilis]|uniref:Small ribosomal subunit protein mS29 n=1 Tax=Crepidotus variabilis TaxID=179855 RepID=A0A9P6EID8_9AGAR|nr:mitochondrial ribosomal death-associated protein 3-domain-containing protein [Crepidotus variabilis]
MSLLTVVSRAGPSVRRNLLGQAMTESVRWKSDDAQVSQPGYITKRKGKDVQTKRRKPFPQFRPLGAGQLKDEVYQVVQAPKLPEFHKTVAKSDNLVGQPVEWNPTETDPLRIFGLPKNLLLEFRLLSKPYSVIRQVTKDALETLNKAGISPSSNDRWVLTGKPGSGKSFLLLQTVEHAIQNGWAVIYIPRGVDLVNSTTNYAYDIRTQIYVQSTFSFQTLQRMSTVNKAIFENITLQKEIVLEKQTIPAGTNLVQAIEVAIQERKKSGSVASSPAILDAVMRALDTQTDVPVLLAVDQFQALYGKTSYRDQHFVPIHSFHLSMPRLIMEYASGKRSFARGAVIGAISAAQSTNPLPIELRDALELDKLDTRVITEYDKRNKTMIGYTQGLKKFDVPEKLTLEEAIGVFEIWKGVKAFGGDNTFYDETFLGKYTESGGNPREFVWNGLLSNFAP